MKLIALLLVLVACDPATQIKAKMWMGGNGEIYRNVTTVDGHPAEEFILANDPKFEEFRCWHKSDAAALIREALKRCKK